MLDEVETQLGECMTRDGAYALAAKIERYWRERGHIVNLRIELAPFTLSARASRHDIRSDLVDGLPPKLAALRQRNTFHA